MPATPEPSATIAVPPGGPGNEQDDAPELTPRERALLAANLVAQMAFGLLAMTICLPSMPEWGAEFGAGPGSVQMTFSGYVLSYGALQLVYGPLSDRYGRRRLILIGLAIAAVGSLAAALSTTIAGLVAARVVQGAGAASCMVVGRAAVQDLFRGPGRTRVMAYVGMAMGLCPPLATVIGGQLHVLFGWQANFVVLAAGAVVLMAAAWRGLPGRGPVATVREHWLREMAAAYARLAREPGFGLDVLLLGLTSAAFYVFLGGAPMVLGSYGIGPGSVGFYIMLTPLSYIVGNYAASHLAHRLAGPRMIALGQAITLAGIVLVLLLALVGIRAPLAFSIPMMLMGIGHGLLIPPALTATVGLVPALAGAAAAVAGVMQQLMGAIGGLTAGWVSHDGPSQLAMLMAAFTLGAIGVHAAQHRR